MSTHDDRDLVWNQALQYARSQESFTYEEIQSAISRSIEKEVVRDTLATMAEKQWLSVDSSQTETWHPGPRYQEDSEESEEGLEDPIPLSDCDISTPSDLSKNQVYTGVVDRITGGKGNAIVEIPGASGIVNLGPIDTSAEGQEVRFMPVDGTWARCLDEEYVYDGYDPRHGSSKTSGSSGETSPSDPDNLNKLLNGHK